MPTCYLDVAEAEMYAQAEVNRRKKRKSDSQDILKQFGLIT